MANNVYQSQYARLALRATFADTASYALNAPTASVALPGGSDTQIQFNSGGLALSGSGVFTFNYNTNTVYLTGSLISSGAVYFPALTTGSQPYVVTYNSESGQLFYGTSSAGGAATLSENLLTNVTVGGSDAGTLYTAGTLLETILRDILTDYIPPTIGDIILNYGFFPNFVGPLEYRQVSSALSFNRAEFEAAPNNPGDEYAYSASFTASGAGVTGTFNYYFGDDVLGDNNNFPLGGDRLINRSTAGPVTFTINGIDPSSSAVISSEATLEYVYPIFYGMSTVDYISSPGNLFSNGELTLLEEGKGTKDLTLNGSNKFIYFAYPSTYGSLSSIKDTTYNYEYLGPSPAFTNYNMGSQSGSAAAPWFGQTYKVYQYNRNYPNGTDVNNRIYRFTFAT